MKRGDLYQVYKPGGDRKPYRTFVIVSCQALVDSKFSMVICAPVYNGGEALSTQVAIAPEEGLAHASSIMGDSLVSLRTSDLKHYVGLLGAAKEAEVDKALRLAFDLG